LKAFTLNEKVVRFPEFFEEKRAEILVLDRLLKYSGGVKL
jgi:hypothetical protein